MNTAHAAFNNAMQARRQCKTAKAIVCFREALQLQPDYVPAYNNLANLLQQEGRTDEAAALYEQALGIAPHAAILHCNQASLRQLRGDHAAAIDGYRRALNLNPELAIAQHNLAKALAATHQFEQAKQAYQAALRLQPDNAELHTNYGHLLRQSGFLRQAIDCYKMAVRLLERNNRPTRSEDPDPLLASAYNDLGASLQSLGEIPRAKKCYQRSLRLKEDNHSAHFNLGQVLEQESEFAQAQHHYERTLALQPSSATVLYHLEYLRLKLADWHDYPQRVEALVAVTEAHLAETDWVELSPMMLSAFPVPMALRRRVAQQRADAQARMVSGLHAAMPRYRPDLFASPRIRIGYVSPDFRQHAVGGLIEGLFECHHRPAFEIFAYSLVPPQDACSERIRSGCDHFVELWQQSPLSIAQRIRADGIHILVDLAGHTAYSCTALFALNPAPLQIQYLGYPGTLGADYIPYIIADEYLVPPAQKNHYSEQHLYLPHAWVASLPSAMPENVPSRSERGLPEQGTVFCCFNAVYKIDPVVFAIWMNILRDVPGSVLWLYDGNSALVRERLRQQAEQAGIDADRLIFSGYLPHTDYLANYRLADLFLDTFIYNAGATAVGALSAGLPVLTCPGDNYAARMGASLCHAVGLEELICDSPEDYQTRAITLANTPQALQALKAKLASQLPVAPLFQPQIFVFHLEDQFRKIWKNYLETHPMSAPHTDENAVTGSPGQTHPQPGAGETSAAPAPVSPHIAIDASQGFTAWLAEQDISLAFTTYQTNRLFLVGRKDNGHLAVNERLFDKPMGLYARNDSLYLATRYQLWQLENRLTEGKLHQGGDRLYVPAQSHITGDLNVHDVVLDQQQRWLFINTDFSCLATLQPGFNFAPVWTPPFISKLVAEDRCHLNGLALCQGEPTYVTACSATDEAAGWRNHRIDGGIVMHIPSNEIIARGLSMPHSPRWYQGKLWLLNSGSGELGYLDGERFVPVTFCPGFVRGLAFWKHYALVGLSKLRSTSFGGLALEKRLLADRQAAQCGLLVIDLASGQIIHWLQIDGVVEELFDVVVLPGVRQPRAFGLQNDDIERCVTFPGSPGIVITKPMVQSDGIGVAPPVAGLPRIDYVTSEVEQPIKYQRVYHLNPENLLPYEAMTSPSLKQRWRTQPPRGELLGVSASVDGMMIGLAVAERWQEADQRKVELLSSFVVPAYRQQPVEAQLHKFLQHAALSQ